MTDNDLIHTPHGREALIWILPMKGTVSEWPSPWHHFACTAVINTERLSRLLILELIRRRQESNWSQLRTGTDPRFLVQLGNSERGTVLDVSAKSARHTRHAILAIMQAPEGATRDELAKLMLDPPDATAAKQEADSVAVSKAQNIVVKADDALDGLDVEALTPEELALLNQAIEALRDLSRKLTARHQAINASR